MREEKGREWWNQALVLIQLGFQLRALYQETKERIFKWGAGAHFGARVGGQAIVPRLRVSYLMRLQPPQSACSYKSYTLNIPS